MTSVARPHRPPATPKLTTEVLRVSNYERVASFLLAMLVLLGLVVFCMLVAWLGSRILASPPLKPVPVRYEQVGGGTLDGVVGESMQLDSPNPQDVAYESDLSDPDFTDTLKTVVDAVAIQQVDVDDSDLNENDEERKNAGGKQIGTGNISGYGPGGTGRPGFPPHMRWEIQFEEGATLGIYARWLDFNKIKLGVIGNGRSTLVSNLSGKPVVETVTNAEMNKILYMTWKKGSPLRQIDLELLARAGVPVNGPVVQFYPDEVEQTLLHLEHIYANRDAGRIRKTRFTVRQEGKGFRFEVIGQVGLVAGMQ